MPHVELDEPTFRSLQSRARAAGVSVEHWIKTSLDDAEAAVSAIRQGLTERDAGVAGVPADDVLREIRDRLGLDGDEVDILRVRHTRQVARAER